MDLIGLGSKELAELGLSFIGVTVPVFPVLQKTYSVKTHFFVSKELLVEHLKKIDPLIIFDTTAVYETQPIINEKFIPEFIAMNNGGFYVRAVTDIDQKDWKVLKANIVETENHNFTFEWNIDNYNDKVFEAARRKKERAFQRQLEADKQEALYLKEHGGKKAKKYVKSWG
jgi:hypothetical protein